MPGTLLVFPAFDAPVRLRAAISAASGGSWPTPSWAITAASSSGETFTIAGDYTAVFRPGHRFLVSGSAGGVHDAVWTVASASESGGNTVITVTGNVTSTSATGTITAKYFFLLIAWDDPREEDWNRARYQNSKIGLFSLDPLSISNYISRSVDGITPGAGDNDILSFTWAAPRKKPHHYTLYYQMREPASSGFDHDEIGTKIRPSSGTTQALEIPGYATSAIFGSPAAVSEERWAAVRTTVTDTYYEISGNHAISVYDGATYRIYPVASGVISNGDPTINFAGNEERTRIPETVTNPSQRVIGYTQGPIHLQNGKSYGSLTVSLVTGFDPERRELNGTSYHGRSVPLSYAGGADVTRIAFECTHGGLQANSSGPWVTTGAGSAAQALAQLHKYMDCKIPVAVRYAPGSTEVYTGAAYIGTIEKINDLGYTSVQANQRIVVEMKITGMEYALDDYGEYKISAADAGVNDAGFFTIIGDKTAEFVAGTRFEVRESTGNDSLYSVRSASLNSSNTRIYPEGGVLDATDDGFIRIWDQP